MSFVVVFTASTMGFALLVPLAMVVVLLAYGSPARQELRAQRAVPPRPAASPSREDAEVRRLAA